MSTSSEFERAFSEENAPGPAGRTVVAASSAIAGGAAVILPEADCISYLLREIPVWLERGWICDHCSGLLEEEYRNRQERLLLRAAAGLPPLELVTEPSVAASALQPESADQTRPAGFAEFLEAHSMKLVALVAALLIFVGMRQIVEWKSSGGLLLSLVPLLPISLTAVFYSFGIRGRAERDLGGYAYCVVAIILAVFTIFSINEHWLHGALSQTVALFAGFSAATLLTAWTFRLSRDPAYLHLMFGGVAATMNAGLQIARPSSWLAPSPIALYGAAHVALGFLALGIARQAARRGEEQQAAERATGLVWMHLFATSALARGLVALADGRGSIAEAGFSLAMLTLLSGTYARWFGSALFAYVSGLTAAVSAALLLIGLNQASWYGAAIAAVLLSAAALLAARGRGAAEKAFERVASTFGICAGAALAGRPVLWVAAGAASPAGFDWVVGAAASILCAVYFGWLGLSRHRPAPLYAAAGSACYLAAILTDRLLQVSSLAPTHTLALDLLPFGALALAASALLSRRAEDEDPTLASLPKALSIGSTAAVAIGIAAAAGQGLADGTTAAWCAALSGLAIVSLAGSLARAGDALASRLWPILLIAASGVGTGVAVAGHLGQTAGTPVVAAGLALTALAWGWAGVVELVRKRSQARANSLRIGAGALAIVGAALATAVVGNEPGWMSLASAGALGLLVMMGVRTGRTLPVLGSLAIVLLCPMRLSGAAFSATATGSPAVLAAVIFALAAAAIYGLATWRMKKPDLVWLSAAALGIAGGGGILFGAREPLLSWTIGLVAGGGMAAGAVGLAATAAWGQRKTLTYASAALLLAAYYRLVTLLLFVEQPWLGMAMLPGIVLLVAASHLPEKGSGAVFHEPMQRVALAAAYLLLPFLAWTVELSGPATFYPLVFTLLSYALVFGISAQAGATLDHPLGVLSTGALVGGWFFGLQIPRSDPRAHVADILMVVATALCAALYTRIAWRLEKPAPAYGASIAGVCAWIGLMERLTAVHTIWWALCGLPLIAGFAVLADRLRGKRSDCLAVPFSRAAWVVSGLAIAWAVAIGLREWGHEADRIVAVTLALYGAAYAAGAWRYRTGSWVSAASAVLSASYAFMAAGFSVTPELWTAIFAPLALVWVVEARQMERAGAPDLAEPLRRTATLVAAVASLTAVYLMGEALQAWALACAFLASGAAHFVLFRSVRRSGYAHAAFLSALFAYFVLLRHALRLDGAFADLYLLPVGIYLLVVAHGLVRSGGEFAATSLRWVGTLVALVPAFLAFQSGFAHGGSPVHALLLLLECTAAITCGIAGRVKPLVQAGTVAAMGFVAIAMFSAIEIWTGLISIVLGIGLLVGVFYLSVHRDAVREWLNRTGTGIRRSR